MKSSKDPPTWTDYLDKQPKRWNMGHGIWNVKHEEFV
jgi:hypothetical protein